MFCLESFRASLYILRIEAKETLQTQGRGFRRNSFYAKLCVLKLFRGILCDVSVALYGAISPHEGCLKASFVYSFSIDRIVCIGHGCEFQYRCTGGLLIDVLTLLFLCAVSQSTAPRAASKVILFQRYRLRQFSTILGVTADLKRVLSQTLLRALFCWHFRFGADRSDTTVVLT